MGDPLKEEETLLPYYEKRNKYIHRIFLKYCSWRSPPYNLYTYFLAPPYYEAEAAHDLCESNMEATDRKPMYDRLEREEARRC